jgi:hypothetical protein
VVLGEVVGDEAAAVGLGQQAQPAFVHVAGLPAGSRVDPVEEPEREFLVGSPSYRLRRSRLGLGIVGVRGRRKRVGHGVMLCPRCAAPCPGSDSWSSSGDRIAVG